MDDALSQLHQVIHPSLIHAADPLFYSIGGVGERLHTLYTIDKRFTCFGQSRGIDATPRRIMLWQ